MKKGTDILLAFYGDDFTGSTDALEFITRAGAKAVLFTETPSVEQLRAFPGLQAFGVAGKTRSLSPAKMEDVLLPAFEQLKQSGARHIHYKICSTFDSSPEIGSIGMAIDCGARVFKNNLIPVLGGMPALGRYCVHGHLFARMGIGSKGSIYRIDRHPSMSRHPVTPAEESDLRIHLGKQTTKQIGLIDVLQLEKPVVSWREAIDEEDEVVLIDALYESHLPKIVEWMDTLQDGQLFSVGSSGIEMGLGAYWQAKDILSPVTDWPRLEAVSPLLVLSGSCSPVTAAQIATALANGFEEVVLDAIEICEDGVVEEDVLNNIHKLLQQGKNLIVHTGERQVENLPSQELGAALGAIAKDAVQRAGIKRIIIAGGDTSSYAARAMDIDAVEMIAPLVMGAPLCKAYSTNKAIDGLEVNFKGGQVGTEEYFLIKP